MLRERKEKKHENKRKQNKTSNMMLFRKMRALNINHKDFIAIQNAYDFFLHKVHIDMNVYKKNYFYK